jgi:CBS domain-containing protein
MLVLTTPSVDAGPASGTGGTVRDLVVLPPAAVGPELTLAEARRCLRETGRDALPVMDGRHLVGIVTRAELDRTPDPLADRRRLGEAIRLRVVYCFDDSGPVEAAATSAVAVAGTGSSTVRKAVTRASAAWSLFFARSCACCGSIAIS